MTGPIDPKHLRVSDAERAHVLALLERATGLGMIDLPEYNQRSAAVVAARTRGELNLVLIDLPGLQVAGRSVTEAAADVTAPPAARLSGPASTRRGDVLELSGWGSRVMRGHWVAPSRIVVSGTGASTKLDFTEAQLASSTVTVEFQGNYGGSAEFIVPPGSSVQVEGLEMRGGNLINKVPPRPGGGGLRLVLTGMKKHGSVIIRHPRGKLFGR